MFQDNSLAIYHHMVGMKFSVYSTEEIRKLSILEITKAKSFDLLGHPESGGVYDRCLGVFAFAESCATCKGSFLTCQGHFGHIELCLPVFNPFFLRHLLQLLRSSCLTCCNLLVPDVTKVLLINQMKLLDHNMLVEAMELESLIEKDELAEEAEQMIYKINQLKELTENFLKDFKESITPVDENRVKNIVQYRNILIKNFLKDNLYKKKKICRKCGSNVKSIILYLNTSIMFSDTKSKSKQNYKDNTILADVEEINENEVEDQTSSKHSSSNNSKVIMPNEAKEKLRLLWKNEKNILMWLYGMLKTGTETMEYPTDIFFLEAILVPPVIFRPVNYVKSMMCENVQSILLNKVISLNRLLIEALVYLKNKESNDETIPDSLKGVNGKTVNDKFKYLHNSLQASVNNLHDEDLVFFNRDKIPGIKQLLEKKEGLFRKNMMGKRVDFAARSVISPDPYINVDEIGIPLIFATKLSYPQPVTPWNIAELKQAVINGPNVYPGALAVISANGTKIRLSASEPNQRIALAKQLLVPDIEGSNNSSMCPKTVLRHLKSGDVLLVNRQPTLHRPSIMGHKARILPGEQTLRIHYAVCKTYNADFDGDEMNAHFPQDEISRAEAYNIANVSNQYLVPKDGSPLNGLIQDHIVAATLITIRGRFFSRGDYQQLVYSALSHKNKNIKLLPPAIRKPMVLWSGKQVVSTILINIIPGNKKLFNYAGTTKVALKYWQNLPSVNNPLIKDEMNESTFIIRQGELLSGVLDKANCGPTPYGIIHLIYELYGGSVACQMLSSLSRLFTYFLHLHCFTMGIEDFLVIPEADRKRRKLIKKINSCGGRIAANVFYTEEDSNELIKSRYKMAHTKENKIQMMEFDSAVKEECNNYGNTMINTCMPAGLLKKFPQNVLQLIVQTGAKGTMVNCTQISCMLGQIELEGARPPLMQSGASLPSYPPYDLTPQARGFVSSRFVTDISSQDFFFHSMAGREGLIDTAVKTSNSGYLQRCIIKHLEGVIVNYDLTVRDTDGSVIQFLYGEDGLDISRASYMKSENFDILRENQKAIVTKKQVKSIKKKMDVEKTMELKQKICEWKQSHLSDDFKSWKKHKSPFSLFSEIKCRNNGHVSKEQLVLEWFSMKEKKKNHYKAVDPCPDPVISKLYPSSYFGSISELLSDAVDSYLESSERKIVSNQLPSDESFRDLIYYKYLSALCEPGEMVGVLAGQSIGEPSTQMTLNTFHFAGRGEMNVTLGIPRLKEILMTGSSKIKTPSMDFPILTSSKKKINKFQKILTRVFLNEVLHRIIIVAHGSTSYNCIYHIHFKFLPHKFYKDKYCVKPNEILRFMEGTFFKKLLGVLEQKVKEHGLSKKLVDSKSLKKSIESEETSFINEDKGESSEEDVGDDDEISKKLLNRRKDNEYGNEPEELEKLEVEDEEFIADADETNFEFYSADNLEEKFVESIPTEKITHLVYKRISDVVHSKKCICDYSYDDESEEWCTLSVEFQYYNLKPLIISVIRVLAESTVLHEIPGISRCILTEGPPPKRESLFKTEGVNFMDIIKFGNILDLKRFYCNNIVLLSEVLGIEAARQVIIREIQSVFSAYNIEVNPRHLSLIADYMTFEGSYKALNRQSMSGSPSPLQKMSFEASTTFLKETVITGNDDSLNSPSACLVAGRLVKGGTNIVDLFFPTTSVR